jgi:peptidyl-prolyl cis-trans isomerase A (cyclophilin A)
MNLLLLLCAALLAAADPPPAARRALPHGMSAVLETSEGDIEVELLAKEAPKAVSNFIQLALGAREWTDPRTGEKVQRPLYDGTIFHRVIPGFMIQGGDPLGTGVGGAGYKFEDEVKGDRTFDRPGLLAMANSGPNTNSSQFFITEVATPWLNHKHTIFGVVTRGQDLVARIAAKGNGAVVLKRVRIVHPH